MTPRSISSPFVSTGLLSHQVEYAKIPTVEKPNRGIQNLKHSCLEVKREAAVTKEV